MRTALAYVAGLLVTAVVSLAISNALIRREQARTAVEKTRAERAQQLADDRARQIHLDLEGLKAANGLLERGQVYADGRHWDDADGALTKAIQLRPKHSSLWAARGDLYTRLGLREVATSDVAKAIELQEPDARALARSRVWRLYVGDGTGYRQACGRMRDRFHGAGDADLAMELVHTCLLVPDPETHPAALVELAQAAADDLRHASYA